ncbi:MAG: hypothetical protein M3P84_10745, partial [Chloroflexota bacterium]|nr:hypothetical protein [Chloroflexota bacterium]
LGAAAAWLQDDLEHVVGYSIVQDAGFVILGLAILDPVAWQPTRTWVLVFVVAKTAFAAWAIAVRTRFGSRRIADLGGWARRSPGLAVALVVIALATVGLPGLVAWQVRARLVDLSLVDGPLRIVVMLGGLASLAYYGRILVVGLRAPSALVAAASSERPRRAAGSAMAEPGHAAAPAAVPVAVAGGRPDELDRSAASRGLPMPIARLESRAVATWTANRAPIASVGVLFLALTALAVAAGALGGPAAAAAPAPEPAVPSETFVPGQTEPPSPVPGTDSNPGGGPSVEPIPAPSP